MSMTATEPQALLAAPPLPDAAPASKIVEVARRYGVSPLRQFREMLLLNRGIGRIMQDEYYSSRLYDPAMTWEQKKAYVGTKGSWTLNKSLSPTVLNGMKTFVANKVMYTALIRQLGFRTTETQAVISTQSRFGNIPGLTTEGEIRDFLTTRAHFPLFGKPQAASGSFGSALLDRIEGEEIVLGDGRRVALDAFCREILAEYGEGYLLQTALAQHKVLDDVTGKAVGTIRIVTVRQETMPEVLYALWKIPSPKAMSDNFWQSGSMIAPVTAEDGIVGTCRIGTGLEARDIDTHPVSGARFEGTRIPFWDEACRMAEEAHALFPEYGVIGWDVAITPEGPALIECNDNPFHMLYQLAYGRGIRNPDFAPVFERVTARSIEMTRTKDAKIKQRNAARRKKKR